MTTPEAVEPIGASLIFEIRAAGSIRRVERTAVARVHPAQIPHSAET